MWNLSRTRIFVYKWHTACSSSTCIKKESSLNARHFILKFVKERNVHRRSTGKNAQSRNVSMDSLESLSRRRFCQHGRQPEVNRAVIDGEWWCQPFSFEINNGSHSAFTFVISNENGWRHHSPSITTRFTSGWRPCWQKRRLLKLSITCTQYTQGHHIQYYTSNLARPIKMFY